MNEIFADTSGWANYFVRTEPFHEKAKQLMQQWYKDRMRVITTNYIISELVALFISPLKIPRLQQIQAIETIKANVAKPNIIEIHNARFRSSTQATMLSDG